MQQEKALDGISEEIYFFFLFATKRISDIFCEPKDASEYLTMQRFLHKIGFDNLAEYYENMQNQKYTDEELAEAEKDRLDENVLVDEFISKINSDGLRRMFANNVKDE